jgi:hypothetical protein
MGNAGFKIYKKIMLLMGYARPPAITRRKTAAGFPP